MKKSLPYVVLDEAQVFLEHEHFWWWYPRDTKVFVNEAPERNYIYRKSIGKPLLQLLVENNFKVYVCGTNLRVDGFRTLYSTAGADDIYEFLLRFDFVGGEDKEEFHTSSSCSNTTSYHNRSFNKHLMYKGGVYKTLEYFIDLKKVNRLLIQRVCKVLQGRPRIMTLFIKRLIEAVKSAKSTDDFCDLFKSEFEDYIYTETMSFYTLWERLYEGVYNKQIWLLAVETLIKSFIYRNEIFQQVNRTRIKMNEYDFVSHGITMMVNLNEQHMSEPMVIMAGMKLLCDKKIPLSDVISTFLDGDVCTNEVRGKIMEFVGALNSLERNEPGCFREKIQKYFNTPIPTNYSRDIIDESANFEIYGRSINHKKRKMS